MYKKRVSVYFYIAWMAVLVLIPLIMMFILAFSHTSGIDFSNIEFTLDNLYSLFDSIYFKAYFNSLILSSIATIICLLIGFPIAYKLSNMSKRFQNIFMVILILPLWSNMLLRIIGWEIIFQPTSILNNIGISLNLDGSATAVIIGMVSMYLPLMIFPIYTMLNKMDKHVIEAGKDLGANKIQTFTKVIIPISLPGIYSGIIMTFLPSATNFALPERLSNGKITLIGNLINSNFGKSFNYNFGSLLSIILMMIIFAIMIFINKRDKDGDLLV